MKVTGRTYNSMQESFVIADNCGGIPETLLDYAFRLGRAPDFPEIEKPRGAVGVYGIGMKRAIFKMGEGCIISTQHDNASYQVSISREWLHKEDDWNIPYTRIASAFDQDGTRIAVTDLYDGIAATFGADDFADQLMDMVSTHYSSIIDKGFRVTVNGTPVPSRSRGFVYKPNEASDGSTIRPFTYRATTDDGVEVFMAVGFNGAIPSEDEAVAEQDDKTRSSENAGWTVICNDRAVLFCDKSELTGWGDAGVPRYHTQFTAVSGVVGVQMRRSWTITDYHNKTGGRRVIGCLFESQKQNAPRNVAVHGLHEPAGKISLRKSGSNLLREK